ncbi:MAG: hypothetical protein QNJ15_02765 [Erythrobacter sp.]|nr:hypothetical protein [Erythrobacter sp.]
MSARSRSATVFIALALAACSPEASNLELVDTTSDPGLPRETNGQRAELLSAFFGLDNELPLLANRICRGGNGLDGMPVIFSTEIDHSTLQAGDFKVTTRSGRLGTMHCVSLLPATDPGELRTALLIGEFGNASDDPPATVEIVGHLTSIDQSLDFKGATIEVTPLDEGPALVMAELVSDDAEDMGLGLSQTSGSPCPASGVAQAVRAIWAGGVRLENGDEPGDAERELYKVTVQTPDGREREITPYALADLGDNDNNHVLCLDTADHPISVSFPASILIDPNNDLNPATQIKVEAQKGP